MTTNVKQRLYTIIKNKSISQKYQLISYVRKNMEKKLLKKSFATAIIVLCICFIIIPIINGASKTKIGCDPSLNKVVGNWLSQIL